MMASNEWKENWLDLVLPEEDKAALVRHQRLTIDYEVLPATT
jgi:hypothetical protein